MLSRFRPDRSDGGAAMRNRQNLHALAQLGEVDVVSITDTPEPGGEAPPVRQWVSLSLAESEPSRPSWDRWRSRCWWLRPRAHPAIDRYLHAPLRAAIKQHLATTRYDLAVVEELKLAPYLPLLRHHVQRVVFDAHNVESELRLLLDHDRTVGSPFAVLRQRHRAWRLFLAERAAVRAAHAVWACSAPDARRLSQLYRSTAPIDVVPNGIDLSGYATPDAVSAGDDWSAHPVTLYFAAAYSYPPNGDAARRLIEEILPLIRRRAPGARLLLIGRDPTEAMRHAAASDPGIIVTGRVERVAPWLKAPAIAVVPLSVGSGTRLKILEAFAAGRPVVSTRTGAEGLEVIDGEHLLLRETPAESATAVIELWQSPERRRALCERAFRLVESRYSWSVVTEAVLRSLGLFSPTQTALHPRLA